MRSGSPWRYLPGDFPPWEAVYQQSQRWLRAGVFEAMSHDLRSLLRRLERRAENPSATILDGRTLKSTPESGERAGYDGHKRKRGSKVHMAVDTLGLLLTLVVTPANEQERRQVEVLAQKVQAVTGQSVELAYVDQGYTGENAANAAKNNGIDLFVVKHEEAKKGFVLLPRRWVVERSFAQVNIADVGSLCLTCGWLASGVWLVITKDYLKPLLHCISWLSLCSCLSASLHC